MAFLLFCLFSWRLPLPARDLHPSHAVQCGYLLSPLHAVICGLLCYFVKLDSVLWLSCVRAKPLQSCPILSDPIDRSPPGASVHGILQARILEWAALPSSRGSSQCRDRTCISYFSCIGRWVLDL